MTHLDALPQNLIVFDGVCVLCSGFFRFMLKHDRDQRFAFATAQSEVGQRLYEHLGLPMGDFETNLVIVDGTVYQKLHAFAAAMRVIGWPWRALAAAEDMMRWLEAGNEAWRERHGVTIELAIGINSGEAIVGNVGSESRMEFTAIGDTVTKRDPIAQIHARDEGEAKLASEAILAAYTLSDEAVEAPPLIYERVGP